MHFLVSPTEILGDENGKMRALLLEDNTLVGECDNTSARGLGTRWTLEADTVIFAIGDKVEDRLGCRCKRMITVMRAARFPVDGQSYEVEDPQVTSRGRGLPGGLVAGGQQWAGGNAKKDGVNAAEAIAQYLKSGNFEGIPIVEIEQRVDGSIARGAQSRFAAFARGGTQTRATSDPETGKYLTNEEMLRLWVKVEPGSICLLVNGNIRMNRWQ